VTWEPSERAEEEVRILAGARGAAELRTLVAQIESEELLREVLVLIAMVTGALVDELSAHEGEA
jgi:hypothetical protein